MSGQRSTALLALALCGAVLAGCASTVAPRLALSRGLTYRVLLPPGYPREGPYPVVLFLHDYFGDSAILWREGVAQELSRRMASGALSRFVLVAPDGAHDWWADSADGRRPYETWPAEDLLRAVEQRYAVRRDRGGRAVAGISMGGLGAVRIALRRPAEFAAAGSLSGALPPIDREFVRSSHWPVRRSLERVFGDGEGGFVANDLLRLLSDAGRAGADRPRLLLRCGDRDKYHLDGAAQTFAQRATAAGLTPELVVEPGGHDWAYWRRVAPDWLGDLMRPLAKPADDRMATP